MEEINMFISILVRDVLMATRYFKLSSEELNKLYSLKKAEKLKYLEQKKQQVNELLENMKAHYRKNYKDSYFSDDVIDIVKYYIYYKLEDDIFLEEKCLSLIYAKQYRTEIENNEWKSIVENCCKMTGREDATLFFRKGLSLTYMNYLECKKKNLKWKSCVEKLVEEHRKKDFSLE